MRSCLAFAGVLWSATASAATYQVGSLAELQSRINAAVAGDVILVRDGVYTTSAAIRVERQGTAKRPIKIAAKALGAVEIAGSHGFHVTSPAAYVEIEGFRLTHRSGTNQIEPGATHIRFSRNVFEGTGDGAYLTVAGDDAEVERNEFRNKKTVGNMLDVRGAGSQVAQRAWIHHNYFHDFSSPGVNGAETIRFGLSGLSLSKGLGIIEHNLFVRCIGENELISIKSGSNTIRYNTLLHSPGAQLTLRHGNENLVYGNSLRGTDGIRIFGDRHQVFSNHLEGNTGAIQIGNGGAEVADGAPLVSHDRPDDNLIAFNTLVDNKRNYFMTGRTSGLGAVRTVFANNVVQGGGPAASLDGPYGGGVWEGNILWQTDGPGAMPAGGYEVVNPLLEARADGVFRPQPGSPAIDSAKNDYGVALDMDGQPRTGRRDKGADEVSKAPAAAAPLTPDDWQPSFRSVDRTASFPRRSNMSAEENKEVIRRFIDQVFEKHQLATVDELVAPDFRPHSWPGVTGVDSFKRAIEKVSAGPSELSLKIEDMIAEGDKVAVRLTLHAVHHADFLGIPAAGKEHTISETHIFYVKQGKVTEHWRDADLLGMMRQLGALPAPGH